MQQTRKIALALAVCTSIALSGCAVTATKGSLPVGALRRAVVGQPRWKILPTLFVRKALTIECKGRQFNVYSAPTEEELQLSYESGAKEWCGGLFDQVFQNSWKQCIVTVSPFGRTQLAIVPDTPLSLTVTPLDCVIVETQDLSLPLLLTGAVGLVLFFVAPAFSQTVAFRISAGGLMSVLLSTLVLSFIVFRALMYARHGGKVLTLSALLGVMGVSATGLLRAWFRLSGVQELLRSTWALAYLATSFLLGMAVTYYFDNPADRKLNTILRAFLRLLGAALVAAALQQLWEVGVIAVAWMAVWLWWSSARSPPSSATLALSSPFTPGDAPTSGDNYSPLALSAPQLTPPSSAGLRQRVVPSGRSPPSQPMLSPQVSMQPEYSLSSWFKLPSALQSLAGHRSPPPPAQEPLPVPHHEQEPPPLQMLPPPGAAVTPAQSWSSLQSPDGQPYHQASGAQHHPTASAPPPPTKQESPLLAQGIIKNGATGRLIKIGGKVYNQLLDQGFTLDPVHGVISPPARTLDTLAAPGSSPAVAPSPGGGPGASPARRASARRRSAASAPRPAGSTATSPF